jgi:hypothetical protein
MVETDCTNNNTKCIITNYWEPMQKFLELTFNNINLRVRATGKQLFMKIIGTTLLLFISALTFGQGLQDTLLKKLRPFSLANKDSLTFISGNFTISDGFGGYTYRLDSSGRFGRVDFADMGGSHVTSKGRFKLNAKQQIELTSKKERLTFNVFTFDKFSFFISPASVTEFQSDFAKAVSVFGKKPVYQAGDESYTADFMIAFSLVSKYLVKGTD